MSAFFNDANLKALVVEQLKQHRKLDEIVQGKYFEDGRGCHLGCLTHCNENSHEAAERMFNIPQVVGYWLESVFENLPKEKCASWVIESIDSMPVGADLSLAHPKLCYWLLGPDSPSKAGNVHDSVRSEVEAVRELHKQAAEGLEVPSAAWSAALSARSAAAAAAMSAESAAAAAARSAAWSAESAALSAALSAESASAAAAWSAALSAESAALSARSAAAAAAWSAAWSAARSAAWEQIADKSIEIFKACPVIDCDRCEESIETTKALLKRGDLVRINEVV